MKVRPVTHPLIALLITLLAGATVAATAHAAPKAETARVQVTPSASSVSITATGATLQRVGEELLIRSRSGRQSERVPLTYVGSDRRTYPIDAVISGARAVLTPSTNAARSHATPTAVLAKVPVADENGYANKDQRDDAHLNRMVQEVTAGMTVTTVIGAALGAILGGAAGCIVGMVTGPLGCFFAGMPLGATAGAGIGVVLAGGVASAAILVYLARINKPFKHVD